MLLPMIGTTTRTMKSLRVIQKLNLVSQTYIFRAQLLNAPKMSRTGSWIR